MLLLATREPDGRAFLRAPAVGTYFDAPNPGEGLRAGSRAGRLRVLGRALDLLVPADFAGEVIEVHTHHLIDAVAYGDPLLTLGPPAVEGSTRDSQAPGLAEGATGAGTSGGIGAGTSNFPGGTTGAGAYGGINSGASPRDERGAARGVSGGGAATAGTLDGLLPGEHALRATTAGVFYARPDPASPPFVTPGSRLEAGQTAALIEVMKCFSPIVHPGGPIPSPAVVREIRAGEGAEVRPGQILFVLAPA